MELGDIRLEGEVVLEEYGSDGLLKSYQGSNNITYNLRNSLVAWLAEATTIAMPAYLAVGVEDASAKGTATSGGSATIADTAKNWAVNKWVGYTVEIMVGVGSSQTRVVVSNTATVLTVSPNWTTTPDTTSVYRISESLDQRSLSKLPRETLRLSLDPPRQSLESAKYACLIKNNQGGGDWSHVMLVDTAPTSLAVNSCDSVTNWDSPGLGSLSASTTRQEGTNSLQISITTGSGTATFRNASISVEAGTLPAFATEELNFYFYVNDVSRISASMTVELSSSTTNDTDEYQWTVLVTDVVNGWNFLSLPFSNATVVGSPNIAAIVRFRMLVPITGASSTVLRLDRIQLFSPIGTPMAIVRLSPTFTKDVDSFVNLRWDLRFVFTSKTNTFLWNAVSAEATVADVTTNLVETGAGTYPTVSSHPWRRTKMWKPAASGYVTVNGSSLDTKAGSVVAWVNGTESANDSVILDWRQDANNRITVTWDNTNNKLKITHVKAAPSTTISSSAVTWNGTNFFLLAAVWDSEILGASATRDDAGSASALLTTAMTSAGLMHALDTNATVGGGSGQTSMSSTNIGPVLFFNTALSNTEIQALFSLGRPYLYGET